MAPPAWQAFAIGAGWAVGLVFAIAAIGGMFSLAGRVSRHLKRRRILHAAGRCRWCNYSGDLAAVALHEAQDHAERSGLWRRQDARCADEPWFRVALTSPTAT